MKTGCDKTRDMRHVYHEVSADFISDFAEFFKVDRAGVRARSGNDEFRLMRQRFFTHIFIIYILRVFIDTVFYKVVLNAAEINRASVC